MLKRGIAISQIFILISSVIAFSFILNINFISAEEGIRPPSVAVMPTKGGGVGPSGFSIVKDITTHDKDGAEIIFGKDSKIQMQKDGSAILTYKTRSEVISKEGVQQAISDGSIKPPATGTKAGDWLTGRGWSTQSSNAVGHIASGFLWAATVAGAIYTVGNFLGIESGKVSSVTASAFGGVMAGKSLYGFVKPGGYLSETFLGKYPVGYSFGIGLATSVAIFLATYKSEETETKIYTCELWQPPVGGSNCEKCNKKGSLPCSEYQCKSLGQSCELLNKGTDEEQCDLVRELEGELEKEGISVWFEELNVKEGELESFVYGVEAEGEVEYMKCVVSDEVNEEVEKLKEEMGMETGVFIVFEK